MCRVSLDEVRELARRALEASAFSSVNAEVLANVVTAAEPLAFLWGRTNVCLGEL